MAIPRKPLIVLIHSEQQVKEACRRILGKEGYKVECPVDATRVNQIVAGREPCAMLTAIRMPYKDGFQVLEEARAADPTLPVIAITTHASILGAVKFLKSGGSNYLAAPFSADQLVEAVGTRLIGSPVGSHIGLGPSSALDSIKGNSPSILKMKRILTKAAGTDVNVLILGETGTGKELIARAIHELSPRNRNAFLPVDCASLPSTLLESELFGHEKGAFTGADKSRYGLFQAASQGTIFLDEIGELNVSTQSKLFRVLQEGKIRQIGSRKDTLIDVRVIAATNRDLQAGLRDGTFREELYFRLNVVPLTLPPLRDRQEDIPLLADTFYRLFQVAHHRTDLEGLDSSFIDALLEYDWPGNIRELMNIIERSVVLSDGPYLTRADTGETLSPTSGEDRRSQISPGPELQDYSVAKEALLESFDKDYFANLLAQYKGNLSEAARQSGIGRKTLYNKLKRIGVLPFKSAGSED
ncbi:sigma-54-dependent transcriptional regulator [Thermodesulfobacteriota bacterium]